MKSYKNNETIKKTKGTIKCLEVDLKRLVEGLDLKYNSTRKHQYESGCQMVEASLKDLIEDLKVLTKEVDNINYCYGE